MTRAVNTALAGSGGVLQVVSDSYVFFVAYNISITHLNFDSQIFNKPATNLYLRTIR
jgi:hypothetical protein